MVESWDDVRVFVAVARSRSLRQAAARLGLTHPTVRRRLNDLEERSGQILFRRAPDGLHLTVQGQAMLESALEVEEAMKRLDRRTRSSDEGMSGVVRLSLPSVMAWLLTPDLAAFQRDWPEVKLVISTEANFADLGGAEADVAIRVIPRDFRLDDQLAGRRAAVGSQAVYGDLGLGRWIGSDPRVPDTEWVAGSPFPDLPVASAIRAPLVRRDACAAGMGIAVLPCVIADESLPRLTEPVQDFEVWVLVHADLRRNPRSRRFRDAMFEALRRHEPALQGETHSGA
jgi:DNA-binding transcriptional LysR family regulator